MMRCTTFFAQRNAGWSETWYLDGQPSFESCFTQLDLVNAKRLALLGNDGEMIGLRVSQLENPRLSRVKFLSNTAGTSQTASDTPVMSLLFSVITVLGVKRSVMIRGVPDARIVEGFYFPSSTYQAAISAYFAQLKASGFGLRVMDRNEQPQDVASVDGTGVVTTVDAHGYSARNRVKFFRTRDTDNRAVTKQYVIGNPVTGTTFKLLKWTADRTVVGGQIQRFIPIHSALADFPGTTQPFFGPIRAASRKVGRTFGAPVGRRKART